jgi:galactose mutarotase-like enzyme
MHMTSLSINPNTDWVSLASEKLTAEINPLGAQLSTLMDAEGRDLLWDGNPAVWAGRAPLLFPIVGALNGGTYRLGKDYYRLSRHGFARTSRFVVIASEPARATFRLGADEATRRIYPFEFELDVEFKLQGATLNIESSVHNKGNTAMPASLGYHPAFRWPLPYGQNRSAHYVDFELDEPAMARRLDAEGLLAPEPLSTPIVNRRLALDDQLFRNDAIIFDGIRSRHVTYGAAQGPQIRVSYPDSPYLGIWTKPGADFICIEPWNGIADPQGFAGDFADKPGVFRVEPGAHASIKIAISLLRRQTPS